MAMKKDLGFFFGLGSVAYAVSLSLSSMTGGGGIQLSSLLKCRPHMIFRMIQAKYRCKKENPAITPKGFIPFERVHGSRYGQSVL